MGSLVPLTKSELAIFEEIIECPKCLTHDNLCNTHAQAIKDILISDTRNQVEQLKNSS